MISKWCIYHLVRVRDIESEIHSLESIPVMNGFIGFFPDDLLDIPPEQEIDFGTELVLNTQPLFILPCRMAPAELKEQLKDLLE